MSPLGDESLRLLLVEPDDGDAAVFDAMLSQAGARFQVRRARTVAEARTLLPGDFSCVVLDLALPDADGLGALLEVRAAAPNLPVLVLTGRAGTDQGLAAVAAGAQDYLVKGEVDGERLARAIRYAVRRTSGETPQEALLAERIRQTESARLERGLLPRPIVSDPALNVARGYRPGRRRHLLGGDFFDVIETDDGTLHAVVGDVSGHDPDAAAIGVSLRIAWRTLILAGGSTDEILMTLESVLEHERFVDELFATLCMVSVAPDRRSATLRLAGHPPPVLIAEDRVRELRPPHLFPPLGLGLHGRCHGHEIALPPSWRLLLYTDGLIEGRIGSGPERLGVKRLLELVAEIAPGREDHVIVDQLISTAERLNGEALHDDVAVVLLGRDEAADRAHPAQLARG